MSCQNNAFKSGNIGIANRKEKMITKIEYDFCIYFNRLSNMKNDLLYSIWLEYDK